jgi:hypothetical protein
MKLNAEDHAPYQVYDFRGVRIPYVSGYDTETKEVTIYLIGEWMNGDGVFVRERIAIKSSNFLNQAVRTIELTFVLPGSYAKDRNGNIIT